MARKTLGQNYRERRLYLGSQYASKTTNNVFINSLLYVLEQNIIILEIVFLRKFPARMGPSLIKIITNKAWEYKQKKSD